MFVQHRSWSEKQDAWSWGKKHWMPIPWQTRCGRTVGEDWLINIDTPMTRRSGLDSRHGYCVRCFSG